MRASPARWVGVRVQAYYWAMHRVIYLLQCTIIILIIVYEINERIQNIIYHIMSHCHVIYILTVLFLRAIDTLFILRFTMIIQALLQDDWNE